MQIPVENVFYLLTYAWGEFEAGELVDLEGVPSGAPDDLLGHVLVEATKRLLRRGLDRGYQTRQREVAGVRGQVDFNESISRMLLPQGRAACRVDELTHDVLHNRILKATLVRLSELEGLDGELRAEASGLVRRFREVRDIELRSQVFSRVQLDSNARFYRFVLSVCRLIVESSHLDEAAGAYRFRNFLRDEARMHAVFEKFVRNFYEREQSRYSVGVEQIEWRATGEAPEAERLLPGMRTDVTLRGDERVLVIDTKYYRSTLASHMGSEHVRSGHFAQIYAYLKNIEAVGRTVEGMLLYPTVDQSLDLEYEIDGHRVRVCTVDLGQEWRGIGERLLALVGGTA